MTFNTKYEIGQKVWVMFGVDISAKPIEVKINQIQITQRENKEVHVIYYVPDPKDIKVSDATYNEKYLFPTKQELLDSL